MNKFFYKQANKEFYKIAVECEGNLFYKISNTN